MATCKYCGKSGIFHQVTKNGLCDNCELFIKNDLLNRVRIFNDSKEIFEKSENPDVVLSRINTAKEMMNSLLVYEHKGIGIINPRPSELLKTLEEETDNIIFNAFERAYKTLSIKVINLKSPSAKTSNLEKYLAMLEEYLPKVKNPKLLIGLQEKVKGALQKIPDVNNKKLDNRQKKEDTFLPVPVKNELVIKDIHPAKIFYQEKSGSENIEGGGGIRISLNITGDNKVDFIKTFEPSTIYENLPVRKPHDKNLIERPPYFPSYERLTPEQRWIYLDWLKDISEPIDIGYVFIYFYGLERNLVIGDFPTAFQEILFLRKKHNNKSFESYSYNALLFASVFQKRLDLVKVVMETESQNGIDNVDLMFKHRFDLAITPVEMMSFAKKINGVNLRYIKAVPDRYKAALSIVLTDKFGLSEFPISSVYQINDVPKSQTIAFANISFPDSMRLPDLPNFLKYEPFIYDCCEIFASAHELVKEDLVRERLIKE